MDWFNAVDATYRGDLRELNELNFARFDAKLEQRIAELRTEFQTATHRLDAKIDRTENRLENAIQAAKTEVVKWVAGVGITLLAAMITLLGVTIALSRST